MAATRDTILELVCTVSEWLVVLSLLVALFQSRRLQWEYYGTYDKARSVLIRLAVVFLIVSRTVSAGTHIWVFAQSSATALDMGVAEATILPSLANFAFDFSQLSVAGVWLRTAISLTHALSSDRRPVLLQVIRWVLPTACATLVIFGVLGTSFDARCRYMAFEATKKESLKPQLQRLLRISTAVSLCFSFCALFYTVTLLLVFIIQIMGRRVDRVAMFYLLAANSFIDTESLVDVGCTIYFTKKDSTSLAVRIGLMLLYYILQPAALLMLWGMGMRDPSKLVQDKNNWHNHRLSQPCLAELSGGEEHVLYKELPVKGNNDIQLDGAEIHELAGAEHTNASPEDGRTRPLRLGSSSASLNRTVRRYISRWRKDLGLG